MRVGRAPAVRGRPPGVSKWERLDFTPKPLNFGALYKRGTRCWCCRRNSSGEMLCKTCRGG